MKVNSWWLRAALVSTMAFGFAACGDSEEESTNANNPSANQNPGETNNPNPGGEVIDLDSEYQMLFTDFSFTHNPGMSLNSLLRTNLDQTLEYPIVVLVDLREIDVEAGTLQMRGGSGLKTDTDGEYRWDPDASADEHVDGTVSAEGRLEAVLPVLDFVATIVSEDGTSKTSIPIRQLEVDAFLRGDGEGSLFITDGVLTGYLTLEDGNAAEVALSPTQVVSLTTVLQTRNLNYDSTGDGDNDAWQLRAKFSAEETIIVD